MLFVIGVSLKWGVGRSIVKKFILLSHLYPDLPRVTGFSWKFYLFIYVCASWSFQIGIVCNELSGTHEKQ